MSDLTQARLMERLTYDPGAGIFRWKTRVKHCRYKEGDIAGSLMKKLGYWRIWIDDVEYLGHRLAWLYVKGEWPPGDLDHDNRIRSDNSWNNLRPATPSQNAANQPAKTTNKLGIKGVRFVAAQKLRPYRADIEKDGVPEYIGSFATAAEADAAFKARAEQLFGEFAHHVGGQP